ncbi:Mini-circle protein [Amycolatopsis thailandensis]|uniref:Mini-circle protein n=1 Tax=Amycolatopsis thailandensis TaxID=589330 RepID=A0A229SBS1_9PSEU|nr:Mini-circle protein [Amycolatopsis thailandensis]
MFVQYLDHFRSAVIGKIDSLDEDELRRSRLASGWTPLELVRHLRFVELRWIEWGFRGEAIADPWDDHQDGRWHIPESVSREQLVDELRAQGDRTRQVALSSDLAGRGVPGPRWSGAEPASLERVLFHLLQEYARHLGHLDIVAELAGDQSE